LCKQLNTGSHLVGHHILNNILCECGFNVDQLKRSDVGVVVTVIFHVDQSRVLRQRTTTLYAI